MCVCVSLCVRVYVYVNNIGLSIDLYDIDKAIAAKEISICFRNIVKKIWMKLKS